MQKEGERVRMRLNSAMILVFMLCGLTACSPTSRKGSPAQIVTDGERSMLDDNMDKTMSYGVDGSDSFGGDDFGGGQLGYSDGSKLTDQDQKALQIMTEYSEQNLF
jgi:hypothetical protein